MTAVNRFLAGSMVALFAIVASSAFAAPPIQLRNDILDQLRKPRAAGEKIVIRGIDLGGDGTDTLELEPMEIWAPDAKILVWGPTGTATEMAIPKYENFKGRPFRRMDVFLPKLKGLGFAGVQNFPTVGLIDGVFRQNLEETGMGYGLEIETIRLAHSLDMLTCPYVFNEDDASRMAEAGADVLVAHMGLTTKGSIGASTALTLEQAAVRVQTIRDAGVKVNPEVLVICHGGPIAEPEDARYILENTTGVHGFFGASSIERLAVEKAITEQTRAFKQPVRFGEKKGAHV